VSVAFFHVLSLTYITDVINVSRHRLSTAEIEFAFILFPGVADATVDATDDQSSRFCFCFCFCDSQTVCPLSQFDGKKLCINFAEL